jgi:alpha-L-fucosidase
MNLRSNPPCSSPAPFSAHSAYVPRIRSILTAALFLTSIGAAPAREAAEDGTSADMWGTQIDRKAALSNGTWLKDSRFAMFIHWGLYSELAGRWNGKTHYGITEWIINRARIPAEEYRKVASRFNPQHFDAREWVHLAKDAGMRHLVITSKHMDGFAMFDSAASPFNIVDATPFKRDPMKELAQACKEQGLRMGFYYSQTLDLTERDAMGNTWDWPKEGRDFPGYLKRKVVPQLEELLKGYGPISLVWFDVPGEITRDESKMLVDLVHRLQPGCLVNSRIGNGLGDYDTLGDQEIPSLPRAGVWESIDTHNDSWGYAWYDSNWKSAREIAERLVRVVSRGGSYMLNVGPDGDGRIPEASARILRKVGRWVHEHEEAIHGADPTPFGPLAWGECTRRGPKLFLHVFQWPADRKLIVPGLRAKAVSARMGGTGALPMETDDDTVTITLPPLRPDSLIPVVELLLEEPSAAAPPTNTKENGPRAKAPETAYRAQYVLGGFAQRLESGVAAAKDCKQEKARWMEKFGDWKHLDCLTGWNGPGSSATWEFRTVAPASFHIAIEYSCPEEADYSEWRLSINGVERTFPLIDTGERAARKVFDAAHGGAFPRFRLYHGGMVDLPRPGVQQITIAPTGNAGKGVRIASLVLTPAD